MRRLLILLLALTVAPAVAQDELPARVQSVLDTALAEQEVFLTCSATDKATHDMVRNSWTKDVAETLPLLPLAGLGRDAISRFEESAALDRLIRSGDSYAEVIALCRGDHGDWAVRLYRLQYVVLPLAVAKALREAGR